MKRTPLKRYDTERRWTFVMPVSIWLSCSFLIYRTSIVVLWEKHSNELQCHRKVQPQFQFFIKCHLSTPYTSIWILYATYKMGTKFVEKCKNWKHIKWRMKCDQTQYKIALLAFHLKIWKSGKIEKNEHTQSHDNKYRLLFECLPTKSSDTCKWQ